MLSFLKNHPFAVEAYFDSSLVLTFAFPKAQLQSMIPECLTLDTFHDQWAFLAVAMVQTSGLRPKGLPAFLGNDFFLIGYRIFVRYTNLAGKRLRGLYILKSETDKKKMTFLGNLFTHYNYTTTDIGQKSEGRVREIWSERSKFRVLIGESGPEVPIPGESPFTNWRDARRFAGPLPFTFSWNPDQRSVLIIQGVRQNWKPEPIAVLSYEFEFLNDLKLQGATLASAFEIREVPYYWKKGKIEKWG